MKTIKKKICIISLLTFILITSIIAGVNAYNFSGAADYTWDTISARTLKTNTSRASLQWKTSDQTNHKQWFAIDYADGGTACDAVLLSYKGSYTWGNVPPKGDYYIVRSHREHFLNPTTYLTGTWNP